MKFEVFNNKQRVFICEDINCIPDNETLSNLYSNKYKIKLNGVRVGIKQIKELRKS